MYNISKFVSSIFSFALFSGLIAIVPQQLEAQEIGAWETSSNNAGLGVAWNANPSIWQTNTGSGYVIPGGNTDGISYPDNNTTTITLLPGAFVTNVVTMTVNQLTVSNQALLGFGSSVSVPHNSATTYDVDIFGGLQQTYGSSGSINLNNSAVIAVENGGVITNFTGTTGDYFANYNATNLLFFAGSTYVMTGSKVSGSGSTFPLATWATNSTVIYAPPAAGSKFPGEMTNQNFGNFIWNWPLQSGNAEPGTKGGSFTFNGTFAVYSANGEEIEDIPGPGFTLTVGNLLITNCFFFPAASSGNCTINISGNFIVDHTSTFKNSSASAIGNIVFDGSAPQILAIYGINGSEANFNWTVNPGATVDFGASLTNTGPLAGSAAFTDNGWVDLEGNTLVDNTNFTGTGIISNSVGTASLIIGNGSFNGNIAGEGPATINLTENGSNTFTLNGANTYAGKTAITSGTLALAGSASIADSTNITINGSAIFNVSGLSSTFTLGAIQTLQNNGSNAVINGAAKTGLGTVSLTYNAGIPSLVVTNGNLTLSSSTVFTVYNSGTALPTGTYIIITNTAAGNPGSVVGTAPSSVTVGGGGIAAGTTASLQISGGSLDLVVAPSAPAAPRITGISVSGTTLTISATNGTDGGQYVLMGTTSLNPPVVWTPILTNNFGVNGSINLSTNVVNPSIRTEFYILQQP